MLRKNTASTKSRFALAEKERRNKRKREKEGKRKNKKYREEKEKNCGHIESVYLVGWWIEVSV